MASEDPMTMFADMKKKKKKKTVVISDDVPGPEADPTYSNKEPVHDPSLGPATAHERAAESTDPAPAAAAGEEDDVKAMFGDVKKKKKKKEVTLDVPAEESAPAPAPAGDDLDFSDIKKKKKKKVEIPMDLGEGTAEPPAAEGDLDFSDIKKKKKKKTEIPLDLEETAPAEGGEDFSDIKKKKKKKIYNAEEFEKSIEDPPSSSSKPKKEKAPKPPKEEDEEELGSEEDADDYAGDDFEDTLGENPFAAGDGGADAEPWLGSDRDYTYNELLSRFFRSLHAANPALASASAKRYTLAPPAIHREPKRSVFANIQDICRRMHRQPEHVIAFLLAELGTEGSIDGSGRLVIKGRFQQKNVENVLRRYIVEYVSCKTCKSPDTLLTKENRIYFLACESCGSKQSVSAIKTGFSAQIGRRKKAV